MSGADISARKHTVIISFDEPECGGAADALADMLIKEVKLVSERVNLPAVSVRPVPIVSTQGQTHQESLHRALQDLVNIKNQDCFVITLLKGGNTADYFQIKELCNQARPRLRHQVVTHLSGFHDVGLVLRNLVRQAVQNLMEDDGSQPRREDRASA